jgi:hypothetical protein
MSRHHLSKGLVGLGAWTLALCLCLATANAVVVLPRITNGPGLAGRIRSCVDRDGFKVAYERLRRKNPISAVPAVAAAYPRARTCDTAQFSGEH